MIGWCTSHDEKPQNTRNTQKKIRKKVNICNVWRGFVTYNTGDNAMNCRQAEDQMESFREGALDKAAEAEIRDHLAVCPACRRLLADLDFVDTKLKTSLGRIQIPAGFAEKVVLAAGSPLLFKPARGAGGSVAWLRPVIWAAATAMLAVSIWLIAASRKQVPLEDPWKYERQVAAASGVGEAFIITSGQGLVPYKGRTNIRIVKTVNGVPELAVEAFPDRVD